VNKQYPVLYKKTKKNQAQQWQICVDADKFFTVEGISGGKLTRSLPTVCKPKNVGKLNGTSAEEQAVAEADSKFALKKHQGYSENLKDSGKKFFEPMLAKEFEKNSKDLFKVRTFIQPKLDGIRCISSNNELISRNGKKFFNCDHLLQDKFLFDGELYNHEFKDNFNKIVSLVRKQKVDAEAVSESKQFVKYFVYDFPVAQKFSVRYEVLKDALSQLNSDSYVFVPAYEVKNLQEIEEYHCRFLEEGYEGSIIRLDLGPYENKRSKQLLKKKDFQDQEYKVLDLIEGEGARTGTVGAFLCELPDGRTFKSSVKGTFEYLAELLADRNKLIGTMATVKYFHLTPDGVPRFPYITKVERESYE
jgi:DNA ligase 1